MIMAKGFDFPIIFGGVESEYYLDSSDLMIIKDQICLN